MKGVSVIEGLNVGEFILNNYVLILSGIALVIFTAMDVTTLTKVKHIVRIEVILTFFLAVFDYIDLTLAKSDVFYSIRLYSAII